MSNGIWVGEEPTITLENYKDIMPYTDKDNLVEETLTVLDNKKIETIRSIFKSEEEIDKLKQNILSLKQRVKSINEISETIFNQRSSIK